MDDDYLERYVMPIWRNPPQRGTVAPSRAMRPGVAVFDGWQALCAACEELPWTIGPWRSQWIDAVLDAWVHNTEGFPFERHPDPTRIRPLTWDELIEGPPCPTPAPKHSQHASSSRPATT
jgi:hypothetical protein